MFLQRSRTINGLGSFLPREGGDLTKHPNYKLTADYDKKNEFDIEKFLKQGLKLHPEDQFDVVNIG